VSVAIVLLSAFATDRNGKAYRDAPAVRRQIPVSSLAAQAVARVAKLSTDGRFDVAAPVLDLTAEGFRLIGGRLDYIDGRTIAAVVYKRRGHLINLFVAQALSSAPFAPQSKSVQRFNILCWSELGLDLVAISDVNVDELQEFSEKFEAALHTGGA